MIADDVSEINLNTFKKLFSRQNNYEIFNERHDHSSFYINPPKNDQSLYWKDQNEKLKNVMAKFYVRKKNFY